MLKRAQLAELPPRTGASPGLLRRRYSMPETIMRKYRLAQQRSDSDESGSGPASSPSHASASPSRGSCASLCDSPHRFMRRDRELMRKSALLRRMWGRSCDPSQTCCCCSGEAYESPAQCGRETKSLDGSRSELRHLTPGFQWSRQSNAPPGSVTPKRQRLDSTHDFRSSDELIRTAMRNTFNKSEESYHESKTKANLTESTYQSHCDAVTSYETSTYTPFTDSSNSKLYDTSEGNVFRKYSELLLTDASTTQIKTEQLNDTLESECSDFQPQTDDLFFTDTSDTFSTSMPTAKEINGHIDEKLSKQISKSGHIEGRISEKSINIENYENNILSHDKPIESPAYDVLEVIVSETLNTSSVPAIQNDSVEKSPIKNNKLLEKHKTMQSIDIDEYVSNILVESLNSLTDQLECMNASICGDRKISIVEKEIKVKLQNTGVNTIVHLSPTSNNQIIFGNEELYNKDECKNDYNNVEYVHDSIVDIREEMHSVESNNNYDTVDTPGDNSAPTHESKQSGGILNNTVQNNHVNKAVLQQIQKLFQDELHNIDPEMNFPGNAVPGISHIEISNVDVYIDDNINSGCNDTIEMQTQRNSENSEIIGGVGAGNYFQDIVDNAVVARFTALPHTDSMEVNTSSSEDAEVMGSDCTSLVDSLDDPNSPRSLLLRKSFNNNRRSELVRSAVDVLDLLPDTAFNDENGHAREKGESFFIRIKDNDCDCEKENIVVADHMPEKIKQRLYRRHRKREMRMECARRSKIKQYRRDMEKQRHKDMYKTKKEIEKDCMAIINALIDDVIAKIAQDEYKYIRIKQRSNKMKTAKSDENITSKRLWKKDVELSNNTDSSNGTKNNKSDFCSENVDKENKKSSRHQIHGKLSIQARPPLTSDCEPKRIYQKSEIHDGKKCIEILEILEYIDTSQSSPETTNSDENHNYHNSKSKKSRIPVPIYEKIQTIPKENLKKNCKSNNCLRTSPILSRERGGKSSHLIATMLLDALSVDTSGSSNTFRKIENLTTSESNANRASATFFDTPSRSRSNSLRFRRVFDIIPEERSSLSVDSSNEDNIDYNRRVSAPNLSDSYSNTSPRREKNSCGESYRFRRRSETSKPKATRDDSYRLKDTRSAATSPLSDSEVNKEAHRLINKSTMTSPSGKSAGSSPVNVSKSSLEQNGRFHLSRTEAQTRGAAGIALACAPCV